MGSSSDENPFRGMKIKDWSVLDKLEGRAICPKCNKSRKYFCYTCYIPVPGLEEHVPKVKLPVKIDIIKHASEIDGKSTAAHAAVIAPDDVTIYTYPCIPDYSSDENVVLIFPGKNALSIQEYVDKAINDCEKEAECSEPLPKKPYTSLKVPINRAVFIDSTWNQSRGIYKDQRLREIPCVVIQSRISQFWRHQHGSPRWFLATIEAVHQFLVELHIICKLGMNEISLSPSVSEEDTLSASELKSRNSCPDSHHDSLTLSSKSLQDANESEERASRPDKQPSKFVKNLALCRGIRSDPGGDPEINLCGPDQWIGKYGGDYDNLLFFFQFMYHKIHSIYDHSTLKSYKREMV
ncbi:DTW domain-containing protein 1 [Thrips palmi]|uniref:tRNA-uridine aminocarboxypropyltransferase 1 n=1 Tax=Thrips palmi TaxID=161013 RepID=A0A6P8ZHT8_THRPL|nr:DTW domain-containing protein 1 [Thrips palmi]